MKLVIITNEKIYPEEYEALNDLFLSGMELLHIRKPESSKEELRALLKKIMPEFYNRIVLHDHFSLLNEFDLKGVHLNKRNPFFSHESAIQRSKSCHSPEEVKESASFSYVFLSPIFDSISKTGYRQKYTKEELEHAKEDGSIHSGVIALGGISIENIPEVARLGFGGVAVLGGIWQDFFTTGNKIALIKRFTDYKTVCSQYI
ncbi:MAG: thiamine phosphate synthase [Candidatus Azobacteroides sp.]|nr:thiamine phosphate synthase [Candidatus Azobacteroides sp.]